MTMEASLAMEEEKNIWEQRFQFLCRFVEGKPTLRYTLHAPDAFDERWNVYDHLARVSIGRGSNGPAAVDSAMHYAPSAIPVSPEQLRL